MTFLQKTACFLIVSSCWLINLQAQSFERKGINYQAVISQSGSILANEKILFRFTVLQEGGIPTYQGEQSLITDDRGRVATVIGTGQSVFSGFSQVDWTDPELKLMVEVDPDQGGYREISNEPIQSVPFSFMANEVINLPERSLNSLSNVETSDIITGQVLQWNGQNWTAGNATSPWSEVDEGKIAYTGKIGLNKANPIFDIDSEGFFQHEGFFQVSTNSFPAMRIRSQQSGNVVPKAVLQFTLAGVNGQATVDHSPGSLNFTVIDDDNESTGIYIKDSGLIGIDDETPSEKLDVAGAIKIGNTSRTNNGTIRWTGSDFEGRKGGNWVSLTAQPGSSSESLWTLDKEEESLFYENGLVGIGTNNPSQSLTIAEDNAETSKGQLLISQEGNGDAAINLGLAKSSHYAMGVDNSDGDKFKIAFDDDRVAGLTNNTLLTLQSNGNLGLGTTSPQRKLTLSFNNNNGITSQMLIEQRGGGDAWMNFSLAGGRSYAIGIDNSDSDKFKIGTNGSGSLNGVNVGTLLELDTSGNLRVSGEVRNPNAGTANLVPIAYGQFLENGDIISNNSTNNFKVTRENAGKYEIELNDYPSGGEYLIIANPGRGGGPKIAQTGVIVSGATNATFAIDTYSLSLPSALLSDATVSFVIYRR
ncbi:MAG: hypothetical protein AAF388_10645 [Bacteroidota bacterium]